MPAVRAGLAEPLVCPGVVVAHHFKAAVVFGTVLSDVLMVSWSFLARSHLWALASS